MNTGNQTPESKIDAICDRFEDQWQSAEPPLLVDFLGGDNKRLGVPLLEKLLKLDIHYRQKSGLEVSPSIYAALGSDTVEIAKKTIGKVDSILTIAPKFDAALTDHQADGHEHENITFPPQINVSQSQHIGPYKLLQKIGEGGMGTVWMAEQEKPVRRRVALKLIKGAMADKQIIARFEAERQALAMMDHPNIAKVLDAGTTETGNPYFVMELVNGIHVNEYCDRNKLTPNERLELFVPVCKAVQHAHQKGIIHRDLKPSNVLVQICDGKPVAKVIDFGLAKALQSQTKLTDKTMFTEFGQVVGTLQYMSPEQAKMDALNVDTRSDIYSLGVMLYELLAGSTPMDTETLNNHALLRVLELIREKEPPKPSHRLSSSGEKLQGICDLRQIQPSKLQQILRGELDWIVMKALEKDRTRRYETANDFAEDINRYLNDEPVTARPPSVGYKAAKFVRKNRGLVTAVGLVLTAVLFGLAGTIWFAIDANTAKIHANAEAAKAKTNEQRAVDNRRDALDAIDDFFLTVSEEDLLNSPGLQPLRLKLLKKATNYYEQLFAGNEFEELTASEIVRIDAQIRYANMLARLGQSDAALKLYETALIKAKQIPIGENSPDSHFGTIALTYLGLARTHVRQSKLVEAEGVFRSGLELFDKYRAIASTPVALRIQIDLLIDIGQCLRQQGKATEAQTQLVAAKSIADSMLTEDPGGKALEQLADILKQLSNLANRDEAIALLKDELKTRRELFRRFPEVLGNRYALAKTLSGLAWKSWRLSPEQASTWFTEAAVHVDALQQENPLVSSYRQSSARTADLHAFTLHQTGLANPNAEQREDMMQESLKLYDKAESVLLTTATKPGEADDFSGLLGSEKSLLAMIYNGQALVFRDLKQTDACIDRFNRAFEVQSQLAEASPEIVYMQRDMAGTQHNLGRAYSAFRQFSKAADAFRKTNEIQQQALEKFPEANQLLADLANSQSEHNYTLIMAGNLANVKAGFKPSAAQWEHASKVLAEPFVDSLLTAKIRDNLFVALQGNSQPFEAMIPGIVEQGRNDPQWLIEAATSLSGVVEILSIEEPRQQSMLDRLTEVGKDFLRQLEDSGAATRAEIEAEPILKRLLDR